MSSRNDVESRDAESLAGFRMRRRPPAVVRRVLAVVAVLLAAVLAAGAALEVTPMQTVTVAGQVIKVGAAPRG
jgi:hypothetical protein